jgi:hypothetical protein
MIPFVQVRGENETEKSCKGGTGKEGEFWVVN